MSDDKVKSAAQEEIEKHLRDFHSDPDYKSAAAKLDKDRVNDEFKSVNEHVAAFISYCVYRRNMKALKARRGELNAETENRLVQRGHDAIGAYRNAAASLDNIREMFEASGMDKAIDSHMPALGQHLDEHPAMPELIKHFQGLGVPEDALAWEVRELKKTDFDLLRYRGGDGTFAGLANKAKSSIPVMEDSIRVMEQHGLPTIEGAGGDANPFVIAAAAIVVAGAVCFFVGVCSLEIGTTWWSTEVSTL